MSLVCHRCGERPPRYTQKSPGLSPLCLVCFGETEAIRRAQNIARLAARRAARKGQTYRRGETPRVVLPMRPEWHVPGDLSPAAIERRFTEALAQIRARRAYDGGGAIR